MTDFAVLWDKYRVEFWRVFRFLAVGGWNTVFGIGIYALLIHWFGEKHYLLLLIPANILSITNAYLGYRWVVFRSSGNFWREYFKCYLVYSGSIAVNALMIWLFVKLLHWNPVWANALTVLVTTIISYFGHRNFSFSKKKQRA